MAHRPYVKPIAAALIAAFSLAAPAAYAKPHSGDGRPPQATQQKDAHRGGPQAPRKAVAQQRKAVEHAERALKKEQRELRQAMKRRAPQKVLRKEKRDVDAASLRLKKERKQLERMLKPSGRSRG